MNGRKEFDARKAHVNASGGAGDGKDRGEKRRDGKTNESAKGKKANRGCKTKKEFEGPQFNAMMENAGCDSRRC